LSALEPAHGPVSAFDGALILLQLIIEIATGSVLHVSAQFGPDRPGVAIVPVGRDLGRRDASDDLGRPEERLSGCHVARFAQPHIHQGAGSVDRTVKVDPATFFQISLINCKSLDLIFRSLSDGHETPLRDEDPLIRRRHAKPTLRWRPRSSPEAAKRAAVGGRLEVSLQR
jgi:hypothetical protein